MLKIALSGGIASGKSTVCQMFADLGVAVIDCDDIAQRLTVPGTIYYQAIKQHFPAEAVLASGALNRAYLARVAFASCLQRKWLEELLHPAIEQVLQIALARLAVPYVVIAVPLLIEAGWEHKVDRVCIVDVDPSEQRQRYLSRQHASLPLFQQIIAQQLDRELRLAWADDVLSNQGTLNELAQQVQQLHLQYCQLAI